VRVAAFAPLLAGHSVDLRFRSHLTDAEHLVLASAGGAAAKARVVARCARRVARRRRPAERLLLVHRMLSMVPLPALDPPARVDVYDFDDALFHGSVSGGNRSFGWLKREPQRCDAYLRRARLVLAGNDYLAAYAQRVAARVEVVPSCVETATQPLREHADVELPVVGWIGSATTTPYLAALLPALRAINRERPRVRLVTVGAGPLPREPWIEQRPWSLESEAATLCSFDIGVMPLPDDPWTRGKCAYKLLQYCAAGVPAVASPVGVNRALLERGAGLPAGSTREWAAAIEALAGDVAARRQAGLAGRRLAEEDYSYRRWAPELATLLRSL
jgi:glycosyltransferase involved in cell wall biosynthesis